MQVLLTLALVVLASGQKKRKPIVTSLNAKWANTPLLLEVEYSLGKFTTAQFTELWKQ